MSTFFSQKTKYRSKHSVILNMLMEEFDPEAKPYEIATKIKDDPDYHARWRNFRNTRYEEIYRTMVLLGHFDFDQVFLDKHKSNAVIR